MKERIYLYKYRPDDDYTIKLLCEQRLHFSHPTDFNDPFDCKPLFLNSFTEENILSYMEGADSLTTAAIKRNMPLIKKVLNNQPIMQNQAEEVFNKLFLCCLSYNVYSPTMWAHYCNNHTGLCLGFDPNIGGSFLNTGVVRPVKYDKKRPVIDLAQYHDEDIIKAVQTKFEHWTYEEEVRVVKTSQQMIINGEWQNAFEKSALVAMFFGMRMPQERQDFYKQLCKQCGLNNVKFFEMTMPTDGTYYLEPEEIID